MGQVAKQILPTFDELVALAKSDPDKFNAFKQEKCEELIQSASSNMQGRLRAQQSHIDLLISRCKNPHHVNVVLGQELRKQVEKFQAALSQTQNPAKAVAPVSVDNVIQFKPNHSTEVH